MNSIEIKVDEHYSEATYSAALSSYKHQSVLFLMGRFFNISGYEEYCCIDAK